MSKKRPSQKIQATHSNGANQSDGGITIDFSSSEIIPGLNWSDYLCTSDNGTYYTLPVNPYDLIKLMSTGIHHGSALRTKINILSSTFIETSLLKRDEFTKFAYNYLALGNSYLEVLRNVFGQPVKAECRLSLFMRRASNLKDFVYLKGNFSDTHDTILGKNIVHAMEYDLSQEVYGVPYYLAAINSAQLNDSATMFRIRYYKNGAHAGFIIYGTENFNQDDWDKLKSNINNARGDGNFKNILVRAPNGKKDGIQLLPISEVAAKDEFANIKKVSAADQLAMHRVPPQLMGVMPEVNGGFGDVEKAAMVFAANELRPIQLLFTSLNEQYNMKLFDFVDYRITNDTE